MRRQLGVARGVRIGRVVGNYLHKLRVLVGVDATWKIMSVTTGRRSRAWKGGFDMDIAARRD